MPMDDRSQIAYKMDATQAQARKSMGDIDKFLVPDPRTPRWRIDSKWIEFECGCRAERCMKLYGATMADPVIFRDTPQQAVYDYGCAVHVMALGVYCHFAGYADFTQWKLHRRARLMGKVKP